MEINSVAESGLAGQVQVAVQVQALQQARQQGADLVALIRSASTAGLQAYNPPHLGQHVDVYV